jgi:hypothetical protein
MLDVRCCCRCLVTKVLIVIFADSVGRDGQKIYIFLGSLVTLGNISINLKLARVATIL